MHLSFSTRLHYEFNGMTYEMKGKSVELST